MAHALHAGSTTTDANAAAESADEETAHQVETVNGSEKSPDTNPLSSENAGLAASDNFLMDKLNEATREDLSQLVEKIKNHDKLLEPEMMKKKNQDALSRVKQISTNELSPLTALRNERPSTPIDAEKSENPAGEKTTSASTGDEAMSPIRRLFGELWEEKKERIRKESPFGDFPNWDLRSIIVKHGDDCKQEQLGVQLISQFHKLFKEANLPLFVKPYHILVTSLNSGLVETITDAVSLHQLKKNSGCTSLKDYFIQAYQGPDSDAFKVAQRNFVESMAGYSLVTYFLQIKDRHNGNIMIDAEGHIIHIDFGFMLSNSPGQINFESAPFKLTEDFVDVMDGSGSAVFQYFKALVTRGFKEVRKHYEKIVKLVEMMSQSSGSRLPCLIGGQAAIDALRDRFVLSMTEDEVFAHIEGLINSSLGNWRTKRYDTFQYYSNHIIA